MTIGTNNRMDYVGAGNTDTYPFTFKIFAATDLLVTVRNEDGEETTLSYPTHYTVSGVGAAAGGSAVLVDGDFDWLDADGELEDGYALTIRRVVTISQTTDIRNQSQVFNDVLEDTYDKLVMIDQQQQDEIERSLKFPETDGSSDPVLPATTARASKALLFDSSGAVSVGSVGLENLAASVITALQSGTSYRGAWATATAYAAMDTVTSDGTVYLCLVAHTSGTLATDVASRYWHVLANGSALARASRSTIPLRQYTLPAEFNDQLNVVIAYDGENAVFRVDPYDLIDFTKNPDTTINHYYVDYVNGSDANLGTSAGSGNAWKTTGKANTSAVSPAVIHFMDEWVGYQNRPTNYTWNGDFKFVSGHSSGATRTVGMRESYTKITFAWVDEGDGVWSTTEASTSATIFSSLGSAMFDAKYVDADGMAMPLPDVGSSASCIATPGSQYHDQTNKKKWVHRIDGSEPDPYDGWMYCQAATSWQDLQSSDTGVLLYENLHCYMNLGASTTAVFRYRHTTTATNNSKVGYKNCMCAGGSGNNFETYDAKIVVRSGCVSKYARADCFNYHTFQTTGTDGEYMTVYEYNCKASHPGYASGWYNQPALGTSCNASTAHDSMHILRANGKYLGGNGATVADVNGCVSVNIRVKAGPPTGGSPKACFWHEKLNWAGSDSGMWLIDCEADDGGDTDVLLLTNQAQSGGSANDGQIYVDNWQGQTDGAVTGTIKKTDGTAW